MISNALTKIYSKILMECNTVHLTHFFSSTNTAMTSYAVVLSMSMESHRTALPDHLEVNSIDVGSHQKFLSIRFIKSIAAEFVRQLSKTSSK
jgi:hypothetical protein